MDLQGDQLRASGLRSTPQRRAILAVFSGGASEHLSADDVYAAAEGAMPGLGRGTVYATLAEFCEAGLVASVGSSEAVRYETNTRRHAHFRCRCCLRIFDVAAAQPTGKEFEAAGHRVESVNLRADGVCLECRDFGAGLAAGVDAIMRDGSLPETLDPGVGAAEVDTPLGPLLIAASAQGLIRVAFAEHGDVARLRDLIGAGGAGARAHLDAAARFLRAYFRAAAGDTDPRPEPEVPALAAASALASLVAIPSGQRLSYHRLGSDLSPRELGFALGTNPLAIVTPCHRVMLGEVVPEVFLGGPERRRWLLAHETGARHDG